MSERVMKAYVDYQICRCYGVFWEVFIGIRRLNFGDLE